MPQERCVPHAIAWRGHNPYQALPEHLVQSYPSLNAHTVGYGPFWENGIPEHLLYMGVAQPQACHRPHRWTTAGQPPSYGKLGEDGPERLRDQNMGVCRMVTGRVRRIPCKARHG